MATAGIPIQTPLIYCYATTIHTRELGSLLVILRRTPLELCPAIFRSLSGYKKPKRRLKVGHFTAFCFRCKITAFHVRACVECKISHKLEGKVALDRSIWWRHKRYKGRGSARKTKGETLLSFLLPITPRAFLDRASLVNINERPRDDWERVRAVTSGSRASG